MILEISNLTDRFHNKSIAWNVSTSETLMFVGNEAFWHNHKVIRFITAPNKLSKDLKLFGRQTKGFHVLHHDWEPAVQYDGLGGIYVWFQNNICIQQQAEELMDRMHLPKNYGFWSDNDKLYWKLAWSPE
jgi:hypothetical protein